MGLIDTIVEYAEGQPKTLIAGLLCMIAVGGVGGGIWISNLQAGIDEREKILSQRLSLQKQEYDKDLRIKREESLVFREEARALKSGLGGLEATLLQIKTFLEALKVRSSAESSGLEMLAAKIEAQHSEIELAIAKADSITSVTEQLVPTIARPEPLAIDAAKLVLYVALACLVLLASWLAYIAYNQSADLKALRRVLEENEHPKRSLKRT